MEAVISVFFNLSRSRCTQKKEQRWGEVLPPAMLQIDISLSCLSFFPVIRTELRAVRTT